MDILAGSATELGDSVYRSLIRFRYDVFIRRLRWHLPSNLHEQRMETDQFDTPHARYIVGMEAGQVVGCARLLPTTKPYLLRGVFAWISDAPLPTDARVWEISRFAAINRTGRDMGASLFRHALAHASVWGAQSVVAVTTVQLERYFRKHRIVHERMGAVHRHENDALVALRFQIGTSRALTFQRKMMSA
ncbi:acyl-homoserine-lactone synthase [Pseudomonas sp. RAC1]|uniref:acyl-homoserine-lactone synthase n=1 Tax=Pseudomonas sp. RAC1 TaxID=3064900 RepID=UPI002721EF7D|nr:acyl-homoserine-lactone synthase [Pseudomonas sp. RAC1]MDV9033586.1 acyl-homoserine-lactone synthase [Pseudomonas sp. RAC1]